MVQYLELIDFARGCQRYLELLILPEVGLLVNAVVVPADQRISLLWLEDVN